MKSQQQDPGGGLMQAFDAFLLKPPNRHKKSHINEQYDNNFKKCSINLLN